MSRSFRFRRVLGNFDGKRGNALSIRTTIGVSLGLGSTRIATDQREGSVSRITTYPSEVRRFIAAALEGIERSWPDPAGYGPPVSDQMTAELIANAAPSGSSAQRS